eukprot:14810-Pelagococcus_subviridis.AAC.13
MRVRVVARVAGCPFRSPRPGLGQVCGAGRFVCQPVCRSNRSRAPFEIRETVCRADRWRFPLVTAFRKSSVGRVVRRGGRARCLTRAERASTTIGSVRDVAFEASRSPGARRSCRSHRARALDPPPGSRAASALSFAFSIPAARRSGNADLVRRPAHLPAPISLGESSRRNVSRA